MCWKWDRYLQPMLHLDIEMYYLHRDSMYCFKQVPLKQNIQVLHHSRINNQNIGNIILEIKAWHRYTEMHIWCNKVQMQKKAIRVIQALQPIHIYVTVTNNYMLRQYRRYALGFVTMNWNNNNSYIHTYSIQNVFQGLWLWTDTTVRNR